MKNYLTRTKIFQAAGFINAWIKNTLMVLGFVCLSMLLTANQFFDDITEQQALILTLAVVKWAAGIAFLFLVSWRFFMWLDYREFDYGKIKAEIKAELKILKND